MPHNMTIRSFLTILIPSILGFNSIFGQAEKELIKEVKSKLDKVNDYQAAGTMKIDVSFIKAPDAPVTIFYKKPEKFAVKKQSGISILPKGGLHLNLSSLLGDDNYTVVGAGESLSGSTKLKIVKLLPGNENSDVVVAAMYIDPKELLVRKSIVTTRENGTYEIEMQYGKYSNWGLPDKVIFSFSLKDYKLPKGMTFEYDKGETKPAVESSKNKKGKIEITYSDYTINKGVADAVFQ